MMAKPVLLEIAKRHLHLETLETRNSDGLDFSDQAIWSLKAALEEALTAGGYIQVKFARKPTNIQDVILAVKGRDTPVYRTEIQEHIQMLPPEYESLIGDFSGAFPWMSNKGGIQGGIRKAIKVTCVGKATLFIDPSGYDYARYVGLEVA